MFNDEQLVWDLAALAASDEILLQGESIGVANTADVAQLADSNLGTTRH
jgi:hypothetical protein